MSSWDKSIASNDEAALNALPMPRPSRLTAPHWDACNREQLVAQQCQSCQQYAFPPQPFCPICITDTLVWQTCSGKGRIYSFTEIHRGQTPAFNTPYVAAIIALDEGWHMLSNIVACSADELSIDQAVEVSFIERGELKIPCFKPASPQ